MDDREDPREATSRQAEHLRRGEGDRAARERPDSDRERLDRYLAVPEDPAITRQKPVEEGWAVVDRRLATKEIVYCWAFRDVNGRGLVFPEPLAQRRQTYPERQGGDGKKEKKPRQRTADDPRRTRH